MDMTKLQASIQGHEGTILYIYDDANGKPIISGYTVIGNPTIGSGRLCTQAKGISQSEASTMLTNDINTAIELCSYQGWWPHVADNDARSRACVEMVFNMGLHGFSTFVQAIHCLMQADFGGAAEAFMDSKWSSQVGKRAVVLTKMIETGSDP